MENKDNHQESQNLQEESSVFTPSKSPEELKAEKLEEAKRQKELTKKLKQEAREMRKSAPKESNTIVRVMLVILGVIVVLCGIALFWQLRPDPKEMKEGSPHFQNLDEVAEMSEEGIKGVITEAYYTNDKHLCVKLNLSNGLNTKHYLKSLEVKITNEDNQVIAAGATNNIEKGFYVAANDYATFTFYISPEFVKLPNDDLDTLNYDITTTGEVEDPSVLKSTSAKVTTTTAAK